MPSVLFALVILEAGSHFLLKMAWTTSHWDNRYTPPHSIFHWNGVSLSQSPIWLGMTGDHNSPSYWLRRGGVSQTSWWGWPGTTILPISASQVARIIGMSHLDLALFCSLQESSSTHCVVVNLRRQNSAAQRAGFSSSIWARVGSHW
jgi:hypothetical protein